MREAGRRPGLFIGSSAEGLEVARAVQELLDFECEPTIWNQDVFRPASTAMADLIAVAHRSDFALLILTPDDIATMRGRDAAVPRDNLLFELGLFVGILGRSRSFHLLPRDGELRLPTDLLGVEPLTYIANRYDRNLIAAVGPACNRLRLEMRRFGLRSPTVDPARPVAATTPSL